MIIKRLFHAKIIFTIIYFFSISSCKNVGNQNQLSKETYKSDTCLTNPFHTYELFIPSREINCKLMPLIIVLDPHGSGHDAIPYFIDAAKKYKCSIAASNLIKNNEPDYIKAINALITDVKKKYNVGNTLFIAGFSGGARMAISYSEMFTTNGILACGALATDNQIKAFNTSIYSIMGMADFNLPEISEFIINPAIIPQNLFLEISGETHNWPCSSTITRGIGYLLANSNATEHTCLSNKEILTAIEKNSIKIVDSLFIIKEYIKASLFSQNLIHLKPLDDNKRLNDLFQSIVENNDYLQEIDDFKKSLQIEFKLRDGYYHALLTADSKWWEKEITVLNNQIQQEKDIYNLYVYKRIKAFLGAVCYSISRNTLSENNLDDAQKRLYVYQLIEPQNPDMYYFNALFNLKKGNTTQSDIFFKKAIEAGFSDTSMIKQNFAGK